MEIEDVEMHSPYPCNGSRGGHGSPTCSMADGSSLALGFHLKEPRPRLNQPESGPTFPLSNGHDEDLAFALSDSRVRALGEFSRTVERSWS